MGLREYNPMDDYENLYEGETIYVLGSGATLDYLTPNFFDDKITIAVNFVGSVFGLKGYYCFSHYHEDAQHEARREDCIGAVADAPQPLHHGDRGFRHGDAGVRDGGVADAGDLQDLLVYLPAGPPGGEASLSFHGERAGGVADAGDLQDLLVYLPAGPLS